MKSITMKDFETLLEGGNSLNIIDVRSCDEYNEGHVPFAINMPLNKLLGLLDQLSADNHYYIICQAGGRSKRAVSFLESSGYNVTNVEGGTQAYSGELII